MGAIQKYARDLDPGIRQCLLSPLLQRLRPYSHLTHTSLDSRRSAIGPEPEAPDNGQAIDAGQAAASIYRMHHANERPVGGTKIGRVRIPVSADGTVLSLDYLLPPHACSRHNYWHQGRQRATSVPPDHLQRNNEENRPRTARGCHVVPVDICLSIKANWPLDKLPNGN
jgi:hypothetical protein